MTNKVWGVTNEIQSSDFYSKHELLLASGGYCSLHYHKHRANRFIVISGVIEIIEMYGPLVYKKRLCSGDQYDVPSLVPHMFVVYEGGNIIEEYYSDRGGKVDSDDIVRIINGGMKPISELADLPSSIIDC